jgi:hypothetical protein
LIALLRSAYFLVALYVLALLLRAVRLARKLRATVYGLGNLKVNNESQN